MVGIAAASPGRTRAFIFPALACLQKYRPCSNKVQLGEGPIILVLTASSKELATQIKTESGKFSSRVWALTENAQRSK
jgi:superfamily II DNA/RNA helicase